MQLQGVLNLSNILEVDSVWYSEAFHLISMSPLLEMFLEGSATPVASTSTDLTLKLLAETVQLEEPVRDRLTIPPHWQVLRIVLDPIFIVI